MADVLGHQRRRPGGRRAVPSAGAGDESCHFPFSQPVARGLPEHLFSAIRVQNLHVVARAEVPAGQTPRQVFVPAERRRQVRLVGCDPVVANQPLAAAEGSGPAGIGVETVLIHEHTVAGLGDLHRNHVRLPVTDADQAVFSVLVPPATPASGLRLHEQKQVAGIGMQPGDDRAAHRQEVAGGQALRNDLGHRLPDKVGDVQHCFPVRRHRGRVLRAEDRARRTGDAQAAEGAVVHRVAGIGDSQVEGPHPAHQGGHRAVHRTRDLGVRAGKVHVELLGVHGDPHPHRKRAVADAIVVDEVLGLVHARRKLPELQPRQRVTVGQQLVDGALDDGHAVLVAQVAEAAIADAQGGDAGPHVAQGHVRQPHVGADQVDHALDGRSAVKQLDAWELQSFLIDFRRVRGPGPGILPTHLGPVRLVGGKRHNLPVVKNGHDQRDVRQVRAPAGVGVIRHDDVAGAQVGPELLQRIAHRMRERP